MPKPICSILPVPGSFAALARTRPVFQRLDSAGVTQLLKLVTCNSIGVADSLEIVHGHRAELFVQFGRGHDGAPAAALVDLEGEGREVELVGRERLRQHGVERQGQRHHEIEPDDADEGAHVPVVARQAHPHPPRASGQPAPSQPGPGPAGGADGIRHCAVSGRGKTFMRALGNSSVTRRPSTSDRRRTALAENAPIRCWPGSQADSR